LRSVRVAHTVAVYKRPAGRPVATA
jgi:hypothetical protein